jgi:hypothetical protein
MVFARNFSAGAFAAMLIVAGLPFGAAGAQDAPKSPTPPEFVPFVVDKSNYEAVRKYLGGLKFDEAAPVVNWLETLEAKAKEQWLADNKPKEPAK